MERARAGVSALVAGVFLAALLPAAVAASVPAGPATYVALGDSYTAGPAISRQRGHPAGCLRSDRNYPALVGRAVGVPVTDASCAGATTAHLLGSQPVTGGVAPPQLDALGAGTRLVTLGIGGNDIGFGEIVVTCLAVLPLGSPCRDRFTAAGTDQISRRIAETGPRVAAALAEVRRRSPAARVLVVGYPAIVPVAGAGCWPVMPVAFGDAPWLRARQVELNAMLAAVAAAAGATYVDTYGPSAGHDACALPGARWIEPVVPLSPAAPVHPNAAGMRGVAAAVVAALRQPVR